MLREETLRQMRLRCEINKKDLESISKPEMEIVPAEDLDTLIVTMFCLIDDALNTYLGHKRRRARGRQPPLADSEVLTIEIVGEYLGLSQDKALFDYFRRRFSHFFPALPTLHRTTFVRQAANLWKVEEALWQRMIEQTYCDTSFAIVDSFPVAI